MYPSLDKVVKGKRDNAFCLFSSLLPWYFWKAWNFEAKTSSMNCWKILLFTFSIYFYKMNYSVCSHAITCVHLGKHFLWSIINRKAIYFGFCTNIVHFMNARNNTLFLVEKMQNNWKPSKFSLKGYTCSGKFVHHATSSTSLNTIHFANDIFELRPLYCVMWTGWGLKHVQGC